MTEFTRGDPVTVDDDAAEPWNGTPAQRPLVHRTSQSALFVRGADEHAPPRDRMNQVLAGQLAQDPRNRAMPAAVLLRKLRSGGQRFTGCPLSGRQPAPQVLLDAVGWALGVAWHSVSFARQDHLYPLDRLD